MAETTLELILRAKNETQTVFQAVTKQVTNVTKQIKAMSSQTASTTAPRNITAISTAAKLATQYLKQTNVEINVLSRANLNKITQGIKTLAKSTKEAQEAANAAKEEYQALDELGQSLAASAAIPTAFGAAASKSYIDFTRKIGEVNTLLDGSIERQETLTSEVLAISSAYGQDKAVVAEAYYSAISSGAVDATNAVQLLDVAARTAIGGVTDMDTAVNGITTILNAWALEADSAEAAANALFVGMKGGKTTVGELSASLSEAAPIAATLNVSFQELIAAASAMTTAGTPTAQAFTRIRAAMDQIIAKKEINDVFTKMGYESAAAAVRVLGLKDSLQIIRDAANGSEAALSAMLGSTEAMQAVLSLTGNQASKFSEIMGQMESDTTAVTKAYQTMAQLLSNKFDQAMQKSQNTFTLVGQALAPLAGVILDLISALSDFVTYVLTNFPTVSSTILIAGTAFTTLALIIGILIIAVAKLGGGIALVTTYLKAMNLGSLSLAAGLRALLVLAMRLIPQLALLSAAVSFVSSVREAYAYQKQLAELESTARMAAARLKGLREAAPDAADLNIDALKDYSAQTDGILKNWQQLIRLRIEMNNLELVTLANQSSISAEDKARMVALRQQNNILLTANNAIRAEQSLRHEEFMKYSNSEKAAELSRIKEQISQNILLQQEAAKANDPQAVAQLNEEYTRLVALYERLTSAIQESTVASKSQQEDLGLLSKAYLTSMEAAKDFRTNAQDDLDLNYSKAIDSLDVYSKKLENAYANGTLASDEYIKETKRVVNERVSIERQYQANLRTIFNAEREMRLAAINAGSDDEAKKQEKRRDLQRETEEFMKTSYEAEASAAKSARDKALDAYYKYSDEVKKIQKQLESLESEKADSIRGIRRKNMNELQVYNDKLAEKEELRLKSEKALLEGNFDLALDYANKMISVSESLGDAVKVGEREVVSAEYAQRVAIDGVTAAYDLKAKALKNQQDIAAAQAKAQLELFNALNNAVLNLNNLLADLTGNSKFKIDVQENTAEATKALEDYKRIAAKGAVVPFNTEVPNDQKLKAIDEVGEAAKEAEDKYGSVRVGVYSDTGEFEQEIYSITNDQGYGAQVVVTAEDGQFYAQVSELESYTPTVEAKPVLVQGDLDSFYRDIESRVRANPPKAEMDVDTNASQQNVNKTVNALSGKEVSTTLSLDTTAADTTMSTFQAQANALVTASLHTVKVDNSDVESAIAYNSRSTSSVHTIYVREVQQRASGGSIGKINFRRRRGYITGAGTATSDDIPAMLSNGEFVQKTAAVRKYGLGFMNMINSLSLPKSTALAMMRGSLPTFNTGGMVGMTALSSLASAGGGDSMTINMQFPSGSVVTMQGSQDSAKLLVSELRKEKR